MSEELKVEKQQIIKRWKLLFQILNEIHFERLTQAALSE